MTSEPRKMPIAVEIIGRFFLAFGLLSLIFVGIGLIVGGHELREGFAVSLAIMSLAWGCVAVVAAIGVLRLRDRARKLGMILACALAPIAAGWMVLVHGSPAAQTGTWLDATVEITRIALKALLVLALAALSCLIVRYLCKKDIRTAFRK